MTFVLPVPETVDEKGFESLVSGWASADSSHLLLDARHVRWVSPYGMLGLLAVGAAWRTRSGEPALLQAPESREVSSYLARIGFYDAAREVFDFSERVRRRTSSESDSLLEITAVESHQDVHDVVDRVKDRAAVILGKRLGYPPPAVLHFSVILSEVCQNIVEHADAEGWVAAQTYNWSRRLGRNVVVISVVDVGRGFRGSLAPEHASRFGDRWGDATALEAAFIHGITRFPDSGRGQGIQQIRKQVRRWDGMISIRSGTARIADVPEWFDLPPLEEGLPPLDGAQISIVLPARAEEESGIGGT